LRGALLNQLLHFQEDWQEGFRRILRDVFVFHQFSVGLQPVPKDCFRHDDGDYGFHDAYDFHHET
jgi:hypothetical protein